MAVISAQLIAPGPRHDDVGFAVCRRPCRRRRHRRAASTPRRWYACRRPPPGRPRRSGAAREATRPRAECARAAATPASFRRWAPWLPPKIRSPGPSRRGERRRREHLGPHRDSRCERARPGGKKRRRLREADADAAGHPAEVPVRRARGSRSARAGRPGRAGCAPPGRPPPTRSRPRRRPAAAVAARAGATARARSRAPGRPRRRSRRADAAAAHLRGRAGGAASGPRREPGAPRGLPGCPTNATVRPRSTSAAPSASAGKTCPPVPPPAIRTSSAHAAHPDSRARAEQHADLGERRSSSPSRRTRRTAA